jgi:hypothetical protein
VNDIQSEGEVPRNSPEHSSLRRSRRTDVFLALGIVVISVSFAVWSWRATNEVPKPLIKRTQHPPPTSNGSYPILAIRSSNAGDLEGFRLVVAFTTEQPSIQTDFWGDEFAVDLRSGKFVVKSTDIELRDTPYISLMRVYESFDSQTRAFGMGSEPGIDLCLQGSRWPYTYLDLTLADGNSLHFDRISEGTGYADAVYEYTTTTLKDFYRAEIRWNGNGWSLELPNGDIYIFPEAYSAKTCVKTSPVKIIKVNLGEIDLKRSSEGALLCICSHSGTIILQYDETLKIATIRNNKGDIDQYQYDLLGRLREVKRNQMIAYVFGYDGLLMTGVMDGNGREILSNIYLHGRIAQQRFANGDVYRYQYTVDSNNRVFETDVICPNGKVETFRFPQNQN